MQAGEAQANSKRDGEIAVRSRRKEAIAESKRGKGSCSHHTQPAEKVHACCSVGHETERESKQHDDGCFLKKPDLRPGLNHTHIHIQICIRTQDPVVFSIPDAHSSTSHHCFACLLIRDPSCYRASLINHTEQAFDQPSPDLRRPSLCLLPWGSNTPPSPLVS